MSIRGELSVLAGSGSTALGEAICKQLGIKLCQTEVMEFSEGNTYVKIMENVRERDCFIIQGVHYPVNKNFMELMFWIDALKLASARNITAVVPFFSYAKADKKDEPRVSLRARVCADALEAAGVDRVLTLDLHSQQIQGFFKKPVDHLMARKTLVDYVKSKNLENLVIASADVGYGKNAFKFAEHLKVPTVIGNKIRKDHSEQAQVWSVVGEVRDKTIFIVDDIVFTGSSLISMANAVMELGAKEVYAAVTHGVLTAGAAAKIDKSCIKELVITDSVGYHFEKRSNKVKEVSVAGLFATAISNIHHAESVSDLF